MERLTYILDTNVIADRMNKREPVSQRLFATVQAGHQVCLCQPVHYEVLRGLLKTNATRKLQFFQTTIMPLLEWLPLIDADWQQAAQFWADASRAGRQLADTDLLVAALATRITGIIVSADADFDALPVRRENWRLT
ncbi:MAG: PIN domain-containing protein [Anaerolineae bacterium]|nr:PIN domain-containing protein [Anaerolineae bacterium]